MGKKRSQADFSIHVHANEKATWQGEVGCLASGKRNTFRSLAELVVLLEHAIDEHAGPLRTQKLRSWDDASGSLEYQVAPLVERLRHARIFFDASHGEPDTLAETNR